MVERDNLHYNIRSLNGYNKPFNFIISEREAGKSTSAWLDIIYGSFVKGYTSIVIRRQKEDISAMYIDDCNRVINKFLKEPVHFKYKRGDIEKGLVDVYIDNRLCFRIIALSISMSRFKSLLLPNVRNIVFDEFICNRKTGERYLKNEAFKFKELYNTFNREAEKQIKCYFFGNPYSLYNPYFVEYKVDVKKFVRGEVLVGSNFVVDVYEICDELRQEILKKNPLYQFDDAYTKYAFFGQAVDDSNILLVDKMPPNYSLKFIFKVENTYLGIFKSNSIEDFNSYYVNEIDKISKYRDVFCFSFYDLVENSVLLSENDKLLFRKFKVAMQRRKVYFQTTSCYYLCEEIYKNI